MRQSSVTDLYDTIYCLEHSRHPDPAVISRLKGGLLKLLHEQDPDPAPDRPSRWEEDDDDFC